MLTIIKFIAQLNEVITKVETRFENNKEDEKS